MANSQYVLHRVRCVEANKLKYLLICAVCLFLVMKHHQGANHCTLFLVSTVGGLVLKDYSNNVYSYCTLSDYSSSSKPRMLLQMFTFSSLKLGQRHDGRKGLLQVITSTLSTYFRLQAFCILLTAKLF